MRISFLSFFSLLSHYRLSSFPNPIKIDLFVIAEESRHIHKSIIGKLEVTFVLDIDCLKRIVVPINCMILC